MSSFWKGFGQQFGETFADTFKQARAVRLGGKEREEEREYQKNLLDERLKRARLAQEDRMRAAILSSTPEAQGKMRSRQVGGDAGEFMADAELAGVEGSVADAVLANALAGRGEIDVGIRTTPVTDRSQVTPSAIYPSAEEAREVAREFEIGSRELAEAELPEATARREGIDLSVAEKQLGRIQADITAEDAAEAALKAHEGRMGISDAYAKAGEVRAFDAYKKRRGVVASDFDKAEAKGRMETFAKSAAQNGLDEGEMLISAITSGFDADTYGDDARKACTLEKNRLGGLSGVDQRAEKKKATQIYIDLWARQNSTESNPISWNKFLEQHPDMDFDNPKYAGERIFSSAKMAMKLEKEGYERARKRGEDKLLRAPEISDKVWLTSPRGKAIRSKFDKIIEAPTPKPGVTRIPLQQGVAWDEKYQPLVDSGMLAIEGNKGAVFVTNEYLSAIRGKEEAILDYMAYTGDIPDPAITASELTEGLKGGIGVASAMVSKALKPFAGAESVPIETARSYVNAQKVPQRVKDAANSLLDTEMVHGRLRDRTEIKDRLSAYRRVVGRNITPPGTPMVETFTPEGKVMLPRFIIVMEKFTDKDGAVGMQPQWLRHPSHQSGDTVAETEAMRDKIRQLTEAGKPKPATGTGVEPETEQPFLWNRPGTAPPIRR